MNYDFYRLKGENLMDAMKKSPPDFRFNFTGNCIRWIAEMASRCDALRLYILNNSKVIPIKLFIKFGDKK